MKVLDFPIIRLTLCLIIGILLADRFEISIQQVLFFVILLGIILIGIWKLERDRLVKSSIFSILTLLLFIGIGVLSHQLHNPINFKNHYLNYSVQPASSETLVFQIKEVLKPGRFHDKYVVNLISRDEQSLMGKVLLNVSNNNDLETYAVDDIIISKDQLQPLNPALNPGQFDYKSYLEQRYIFRQIFSTPSHLRKLTSAPRTLSGFAAKFRENINVKLKRYPIGQDERALINALLLGQRQDMNPEIIENYSNAGAIHILAVSGLHVGIVLWMLQWLLKPLNYIRRGKLYKVILILLFLWSFAIVAGLSASVTRAVMMFSIVAVAINIKRKANIYNTLAISMFTLLLIKPQFLFDVGFQMSYLAVIAIVSIQPWLQNLIKIKIQPFKMLWQILTVTLAAQLGVVPISLYYFHQFPGLFFVSNLIIIPFLGLILGLGIVIILLALANILPIWLATIYHYIIAAMNWIVGWVSQQEQFIFKDISFSLLKVFTTYLLIISCFQLFRKYNFQRLTLFMSAIILFQVGLLYDKRIISRNALTVFHQSKQSVIGIKKNQTLAIGYSKENDSSFNNNLRNYQIAHSILTTTSHRLEPLYLFHQEKIIVIDSSGTYNHLPKDAEYLVLSGSPKINLDRVLNALNPRQIIVDGNNYTSYVDRWEASCKTKNIPFHHTGKKGAFILSKK